MALSMESSVCFDELVQKVLAFGAGNLLRKQRSDIPFQLDLVRAQPLFQVNTVQCLTRVLKIYYRPKHSEQMGLIAWTNLRQSCLVISL